MLLACAAACTEPGAPGETREIAVRVSWARRTAWRHVPAGYRSSVPTPLLVFFHGRGWWAKDALEKHGLTEASDRNGFIVLVPESLEVPDCGAVAGGKHWDLCVEDPAGRSSPDVAFTRELVERTAADLSVDPRRVYLVGHSFGAYFAYHAAMSLPDEVTAFAAHAGGLTMDDEGACWPPCPPPGIPRVPGLLLHGAADALVPQERSALLFAALQAEGFPCELVVLPSGSHDYDPALTQRVWDWFLARDDRL